MPTKEIRMVFSKEEVINALEKEHNIKIKCIELDTDQVMVTLENS